MRGHDVRNFWLYNEIGHGAHPGERGIGWQKRSTSLIGDGDQIAGSILDLTKRADTSSGL